MPKIAFIGAGSTVFAKHLMGDILSQPELADSHIALMDIDAERLKTIAWTLLGLEIIHQVIGLIARVASTEAHPLDINREFSLTGWLAVLFAFVLARVFEQGAKVRDDLEGTI